MLTLLLASVYLGVSADSGAGVWVALEVNLLSFLCILMLDHETLDGLPMKYFLVQVVGSTLALMGILTSFSGAAVFTPLLQAGLLLKLGAAPFHGWLVGLVPGLSLDSFVLILSVQKTLPLLLLLSAMAGAPLILLVVAGSLVGIAGSLGQSAWKSLLAYSSVFSLAWLVVCGGQFSVALVYLSLYSGAVLAVSVSVWGAGETHSEATFVHSLGSASGASMLLGFLSLGGLPPFIGFFGKVYVLNLASSVVPSGVLGLLVGGSIWMLFLYVRLFFYGSLGGGTPPLTFSPFHTPWGASLLLASSGGLVGFCLWVGVSTLSFELKGNN